MGHSHSNTNSKSTRDSKSTVQRKSKKEGAGSGNDLDQYLAASRGGGSAMPRAVQRKMEGAFGSDFADVRVHSGAATQAAASGINARAFTSGKDVHLGRGASVDDTHLMAHELTHTLHQGAVDNTVQREAEGGAELQEADAAADKQNADPAAEGGTEGGGPPVGGGEIAATADNEEQKEAAPVQQKTMVGRSNDALEVEADRIADQVVEGPQSDGSVVQAKPLHEQITRAGAGAVQRDGNGGTPNRAVGSTRTYTASMGAIAWIPASAGLPVSDPAPPGSFPSGMITPASGSYRYCNRFTITLRVQEYERSWRLNATLLSRELMGSSHGIPPIKFTTGRSLTSITSGTHGTGYQAAHTVGARTALPNPGGIFGGEQLKFPPIWTQLNIKIYRDGHIEGAEAVAWSHFPTHSVYDQNGALIQTSTPNYAAWQRWGWGAGRSGRSRTPGGRLRNPNDHTGNPWNQVPWPWS